MRQASRGFSPPAMYSTSCLRLVMGTPPAAGGADMKSLSVE
jgi:hypothetical protein